MVSLTRAMLTFRDMTDSRQAEQIRRDFVANVSHELRSPISAVVGTSGKRIQRLLPVVARMRRSPRSTNSLPTFVIMNCTSPVIKAVSAGNSPRLAAFR